MHTGRSACLGLACVIFSWAIPARATPPSEACKTGAGECRDAYVGYEKCLQGPGANEDKCKDAHGLADKKCHETTSVCHTDGSRKRPRPN